MRESHKTLDNLIVALGLVAEQILEVNPGAVSTVMEIEERLKRAREHLDRAESYER